MARWFGIGRLHSSHRRDLNPQPCDSPLYHTATTAQLMQDCSWTSALKSALQWCTITSVIQCNYSSAIVSGRKYNTPNAVQKDFQQKIHQQKNNYHNIILLFCWSLAYHSSVMAIRHLVQKSIRFDSHDSLSSVLDGVIAEIFDTGEVSFFTSQMPLLMCRQQLKFYIQHTNHITSEVWTQPPTYESLNMYTCCYTMLLTGVNQNYCCKGHWNFIKYTQKWKKPHPALWLPTMLSLLHFNNDQLHNRYFKQIYDKMQWKAPN